MTKAIAFALGALVCAATAFAEISPTETRRLDDATNVIREFRATPDKGIPENLWSDAECVAVIPGLKKAAFIVGGEFGKGVLSCRNGRTWGAPIFLELGKGSAGFQIGAEQVDLVLLMMNRRGVDKLLGDKVSLGADASVAAGPVGRAAEAGTDAKLKAEILAYSRAQGAFAGVDISGGVLRPDKGANERAYGAAAMPREILAKGSAASPRQAQAFVRTLNQEARATTGRKTTGRK